MLSVPLQLIAWRDRPQNDPLCVERDVKHLFTLSLSQCHLRFLSLFISEENLGS